MSRFGPANGFAPGGLDATATGSITPGYGMRTVTSAPLAQPRAATGAPVPSADVSPRAPTGWPPQTTSEPLVYGRVPTPPAMPLDRGSTGSIGTGPVRSAVASEPLAPLASNPVRDAVDRDPIARAAANGTAATVARTVPASAERPRGIVDKVRAALPSMPRAAREPREPRPTTPLRSRVAAAKAAVGWGGEGGRVTVGEGQTLYNLSKRYGVPVAAIMAANGIADPTTVRIGQSLVIPQYTYGQRAAVSAPDADPTVRASTAGRGMIGEVMQDRVPPPSRRVRQVGPAAVVPTTTSATASSAGPGTVTVQPGDTLYSIARRNGVSLNDLRARNGLPNDAIRIGQVLALPSGFAATGAAEPARAAATTNIAGATNRAPARIEAPAAPRREPVVAASPVAGSAPALPRTNPPVETDPIQTAALERPATSATASPSSSGGLRWPVNGRVVGAFGGARKGIDISVPNGTPVRAAEGGTVIYAGSGLKELGKTVLIQHDDGLVTVYGHADALQVAKGQKVQRGDVIAASGKTGSAETPRVHFQVRKGSTPVNPATYLN